MTLSRLLLPALILVLPATRALAAVEPELAARLPLKPEIRKVLDSCVYCHGAVVNGEKEVRGDVDLSTDDEIKGTVMEIGRFKQYILEDKMPHKPKLSRRLRNDPAAQVPASGTVTSARASVVIASTESVTAPTMARRCSQRTIT